MKLHEFQAKDILGKAGITVPNGQLVTTSDQATTVVQIIKGPPWMIKAQIHAGGRGKGGGIKVAHYPYEVVTATESLLGKPLVTRQTGPDGVVVNQVLIEEGIDIDREYYLSVSIDRSTAEPVMIFSQAGGMDIEEVAAQSPALILKEHIDPVVGWMPHQARNLVYKLDPPAQPATIRKFISVMANVYRIFLTLDCSLVEINPLAITKDGRIIAVDTKISIDDNALFRQKELLEFEDTREKDSLELMADKYHLSYIRLKGNVGAMVNGAGLAMATMDVIKMAGAEPANFLDVGGGASEEMVTKGLEIILKDKRIKAIIINIFGGILRCDVLARGVLAAAKKKSIRVPLIVRLEGTNVEEGKEILRNSDLKFLVANNLAEAAKLIAKQVSKAE
ncbi:MAG: ADP-forming succinate--CoA ligase subunit beta [Deltaproteobacteria bacterium]|nr:ADP-forming succinate--CoA ligase subunit beta [Deltaproteobacteria bacterium]MBW1738142.1 ADP-forming succinate--CoA ligase subunit beta [Deltaproteobacteria bacterium]MBW1910882.1 ADP-forming succinate--CoA ligase subunit beta [Deltaproteobacteria bacterium]MBW2035115.1 ADP-forming succinate--CoA ligase subunit beta [Deltaproteobacteria bacterium]MBW2115395.1 ADP-forming succinate--CoA ligase subunit beta [Deltaproteobacteria bacterium]